MTRRLGTASLASALFISACGGAQTPKAAPSPGSSSPAAVQAPAPVDPLARAHSLLRASRYSEAEAAYRKLGEQAEAQLGLARVQLMTGRYDEAAATARTVPEGPLRVDAAVVGAEGLRRLGKNDEAAALLRAVVDRPEARHARVLLGEILVSRGQAADAEPYLMSLIEDYNEDRIEKSDAFGFALVGRAAALLESPADANDAFNEAEKTAAADDRVLLWRAELFLDNYDSGHAEEVLSEVLEHAPNHPEALAWMAEVKLAQNLDFEAADALAARALEQNPKLSRAFFVRAGIALRDLDFERADEHLNAGLSTNPSDLELLSMRAAVRFLADDEAGFEAAKRAVLDRNPRYTRLYQVIGDYADWEHRYEEIVDLMGEALLANSRDAKVRAQLGLNLIRLGDDEGGVAALKRAFASDPYNARVFNTLNLYEKTIPAEYESVEHAPFVFRYSKAERPLLDRYVPAMLDDAWKKMRRYYAFIPKTPIGIELYPVREHFAVRTSGLPQTFIQGVCFGQTLAAISPKEEQFNVGMTLWHELAHVFHIQKSRSRVPRWFTEGLAEYETIVARPEWAREQDPDLYEALRLGRLPRVAAMNQAFSHARDMSDMATAYYASSQIVIMLAERYGRDKLNRMLDLWGESKRTREVVQTALGVDPDALDAEFRAWTKKRLERYDRQFMPLRRPDEPEVAEKRAKQSPKDVTAVTRHAHALLAAGDAAAEGVLQEALALDPKHPDAVWLGVRIAIAKKDLDTASRHIATLLSLGKDGYSVALARAEIANMRKDAAGERKALEEAAAFDPPQSEPWARLAKLAKASGDHAFERRALEKLAELEQHDGSVYRRLIRVLIDAGEAKKAVEVGRTAVFADMENLGTHALYGEALEAAGRVEDAVFEYESATLCEAPDKARAVAHARLSEGLAKLGRTAASRQHMETAKRLDPNVDPRAK